MASTCARGSAANPAGDTGVAPADDTSPAGGSRDTFEVGLVGGSPARHNIIQMPEI